MLDVTGLALETLKCSGRGMDTRQRREKARQEQDKAKQLEPLQAATSDDKKMNLSSKTGGLGGREMMTKWSNMSSRHSQPRGRMRRVALLACPAVPPDPGLGSDESGAIELPET